MPTPGVYITTICPPQDYTDWQIEQACAVAHGLGRGRFVLAIAPAR